MGSRFGPIKNMGLRFLPIKNMGISCARAHKLTKNGEILYYRGSILTPFHLKEQ